MNQSHPENIFGRSQRAAWCCQAKSPRLIILLITSAILASSATAQTAQFTQGSSSTNTMTLQVPLGSLPGRGVSLPINLNYSSKVWRLGFIKSVHYSYAGSNSVAEAIYSEYATAGWTTSLDVPTVEWPKQNDLYWYTGKPYAKGTHYPYTFRVARVFIHMPDGSIHELRKADAVYQDYGSIDMVGTFYAVDGSRLRYDSSGAQTGTLYLEDGTRYVLTSDTAQYIDRNGNTLTYSASNRQWTDTLGRVIGMPLPANPHAGLNYAYSIPGLNGTTIDYTLKFENLSQALTPGSPGLKPLGDYYLPNPSQTPGDYNSNNFTQATQGASMFVSGMSDPDEMDYQTYTRVIGRGQVGSNVFDPVVLAEIILPNEQSYKLSYNNFGELDKVIYPTGAYQRYQYGVVPALGNPLVPYPQATRGITARWLSANGLGTDEVQWLYEFTGPGYGISVTAPGPTGAADGIKTVTYIHNLGNPQNNFGYDNALNGMVYEERVHAPASQGSAIIRRTLSEWGVSSATYNRPPQATGTYTATRNPRPTKTVSLKLDTGGNALTSASTSQYDTTYQFDVGVERTSTSEFGFTTVDQTTAQNGSIASMPLGPLVRTSETTYLTGNNNYRSRNLLGLPVSNIIRNAAGTPVAQSTINYDEAEYPLLSYGSLAGWIDPQTNYRGNPTTVSHWLDYPISSWIQTHTQYDQCGNVRNVWDAVGVQSQLDYSASYVRAFPTTVTSAVPDPTGTHGQTIGLVSSSVYDFNTGRITSSTDHNNRTTTFEYNDPLNRPTKINRPDGGWTSSDYNDVPGNTWVRTRTLQQTTPAQLILESYQYLDKLGRSVRSFVNEGSSYVTVDTQYDNLGRVWRVSNPYRSSSLTGAVNPDNKWTTKTYDALSRVTAVIMPDGSQATTAYGYNLQSEYLGTTVLVTDPSSKTRKSIADAQGRLIEVIEDPTDLAYQTYYTYDALNNLRKVQQGSQARYFGYDSLSRLIRTRNIEQAVNPALNWLDPVTGYNGGWTTGLSYDRNGNITSRIDARNITTTYGFDGLNRNTTIDYSNTTVAPDIDRYYDNPAAGANGKGRFWYDYSGGLSSGEQQVDHRAVDLYDAMGRPTTMRQMFMSGGVWTTAAQVSRTFDLAGNVVSQIYPSGRIVNYQYDSAGRASSFSGNLGDGVTRTYSTGMAYSPTGGMTKEQFGTGTPVYNKSFYNSRGQLSEIRVSTSYTGPTDTTWNRGAVINQYSLQCSGPECNATDNNGNLRKQQVFVPANDQSSSWTTWHQQYDYDSLNRLKRVHEYTGNSALDWQQEFLYDPFGNRRIDTNPTATYGGVNDLAFEIESDSPNNRLYAPGDLALSEPQRRMQYDAAGNLKKDTYTGAGDRLYDAENHMTKAWANSQWQEYSYNADGLRVRRKVNGVETWQVYGFDGELLAEYPANGASSIPQKEYGYRNGRLLITATAPAPVNVALASNGATASASSTYGTQAPARGIDGDRKGTGYNCWTDDTSYAYPDWIQVDFGGSKTINEIDVFGLQQNYTSPVDPTLEMTSSYALTSFEVQYWTGSAWATVPGGSVSSNDKVWRKFSFAALSTSKIRVNVTSVAGDNHTQVVEVEAYGPPPPPANVALAANGATTSASSTYGTQAPANVNNGERKGLSYGWWTDNTSDGYPDWVEVDFAGAQTISEIDVIGLQEPWSSPVEPTLELTSRYALSNFEVQYWTGSAWAAVPGGTVTGNNKVWRKFTFAALTTSKIRVNVSNVSGDNHTQVVELEAWGTPAGSGSTANINWLVADQLGTPRMIIDKTGSLANVKRHDYLPFGEELFAGTGGRTTLLGYTGDSVRQHFTGYEADAETSLNFAQARYQSATLARFTSVDPLGASATVLNPQSFNRYTYVSNNPTNLTDPDGMMAGAQVGWSGVSDGFWGSSFDFNAPHFGGPGIIAEAEASHDRWVDIDRAGGDYGDADYPEVTELSDESAVVDATDASLASGLGAEMISTETVIDLPNDIQLPTWVAQNSIFGDGDCAQMPQFLAERQGNPMGEAGFGRWRAGRNVMGNKIKRGTVIASGWDANGYYPNYRGGGNHVAIYLHPIEGGFRVLEQVGGKVQYHDIVFGTAKNYYSNPSSYRVVKVGNYVPGMPRHQKR